MLSHASRKATRGELDGWLQATARQNAWRRLISSMAREMFLWPSRRRIEIARLLNAASTPGWWPLRARQASQWH